jgi:hypothetical protein
LTGTERRERQGRPINYRPASTKQQLLRAACEVAGGTRPLSERLGVSEGLVRKCMFNGMELPDALLLRTVDIILADREARLPGGIAPPSSAQSFGDQSS